ncbi:MAG: pyridoxal phosphate-dependent aminotransferase [Pseudomonadota bacterium]
MAHSPPEDRFQAFIRPEIAMIPPSATLEINELSMKLENEGRTVYRFGFGQSPFPVPVSVVEELRKHAYRKEYLPVQGLAELRREAAAYLSRKTGASWEASRILVGPGSKELMFLLQLASRATLLLPAPSWVSYAPQAAVAGGRVEWISTRREHRWQVQPGELEQAAQAAGPGTKVLVLNTPSNPTGHAYERESLSELADVCRKENLWVLSDEIYGDLHHEGNHVSIASFYPEGTFVTTGLSKWAGAGGWRLGIMGLPAGAHSIAHALAALASETFSCVASPVQWAAVQAFRQEGDVPVFLDHSRRFLKALGQWVATSLRKAGIETEDPAGAFYLFPDFEAHRNALRARGIETSAALCEHLLEETGVALLPGSAFGMPGTSLTARLAYVNFDGQATLDRLARNGGACDEAVLRELAPDVIRGIETLCEWFRALYYTD